MFCSFSCSQQVAAESHVYHSEPNCICCCHKFPNYDVTICQASCYILMLICSVIGNWRKGNSCSYQAKLYEQLKKNKITILTQDFVLFSGISKGLSAGFKWSCSHRKNGQGTCVDKWQLLLHEYNTETQWSTRVKAREMCFWLFTNVFYGLYLQSFTTWWDSSGHYTWTSKP